MIESLTSLFFFFALFSFFWLAQWYIYRRFTQWSRHTVRPSRCRLANRGFLAVLSIGNVLFFSKYAISNIGLYEYSLLHSTTANPGAVFFGSVLLATLILGLVDVGRIVATGVKRAREIVRRPVPRMVSDAATASRRRFIRTAGIGVIGAAVGAPAISVASSTRDYEIKRIPLYYKDLPTGLDGFEIVQVSDIHSGVFMNEQQIRDIFDLVNSLHPQLITMTGDFVDRADSEIPAVHRAARMLQAEYGIFGCLGNHDHFATGERVSAALEDAGLVMLNNANRELMVNGESLVIAGIDDIGGRSENRSDFEKASRGIRPDSFKIMLAHQPKVFDAMRKAGMNLTLSGHTHGGQVAFNVLGMEINPIHLIHEYAKGLYEKDGSKLYVNAGVGMVGIPVRLVRPEISLFTLRGER